MPGRPFLGTCSTCAPAPVPTPSLVDFNTCVTCHDEADVLLEIRDDAFDSGRLLVPSCYPHVRESFEYLCSVEAPRRGWRYAVTNPAP